MLLIGLISSILVPPADTWGTSWMILPTCVLYNLCKWLEQSPISPYFLTFWKRLTEFCSKVQGSVKLPKGKKNPGFIPAPCCSLNHTCMGTHGYTDPDPVPCFAVLRKPLKSMVVHFSDFWGFDQLLCFVTSWKWCVLQLIRCVEEYNFTCKRSDGFSVIPEFLPLISLQQGRGDVTARWHKLHLGFVCVSVCHR